MKQVNCAPILENRSINSDAITNSSFSHGKDVRTQRINQSFNLKNNKKDFETSKMRRVKYSPICRVGNNMNDMKENTLKEMQDRVDVYKF